MKTQKSNTQGFTLIEILLVIALIAILAGIVILAVNPGKQLADGRNVQRKADINTILNAIYQYAIDNNGALPTSIATDSVCNANGAYEICKEGGSCTGLTDLSILETNQKYLTAMPQDPSWSSNINGDGYFVVKNNNNRVTVCAPGAELNQTISVTR